MAFPTSDMPGHKRLRERADVALERALEAPDVDFKESATWQQMRWKITCAALGMGNLPGGGMIIIGVSERGRTWNLTGISEDHLSSYDADVILDQLDTYISPGSRVEAVLHYLDDNPYLVLDIPEFDEVPLICKRDGPPPEGRRLVRGGVYIRPASGRPRTERVASSEDQHALLELAAEKRARRILEQDRRLGLIAPDSSRGPDDAQFDEEINDIDR